MLNCYYLYFDKSNMQLMIRREFTMGVSKSRSKELALSSNSKNTPDKVEHFTLEEFKSKKEDSTLEKVVRNLNMFLAYVAENYESVIEWGANESGFLQEARISALAEPSEKNPTNSGEGKRSTPSKSKLAREWGYDSWDEFYHSI